MYFPVVQIEHLVVPALGASNPEGHDVQFCKPVPLLYFPAGQSWQLDEPLVEEILPVGHKEQFCWPVWSWNFPSGHNVQELSFKFGLYFPVGQAKQVKSPYTEYFPSEQASQPDRSSLDMNPALHWVQKDSPKLEYFPFEHNEQTVWNPSAAKKPGEQDEHVVKPYVFVVEYFPAMHGDGGDVVGLGVGYSVGVE
jgi:hypothetical protein